MSAKIPDTAVISPLTLPVINKPVWLVKWNGTTLSGNPTNAITLAQRGVVNSIKVQISEFDIYCAADDSMQAITAAQTYAVSNSIVLIDTPISVTMVAAAPSV
jgi:hypothetical protein